MNQLFVDEFLDTLAGKFGSVGGVLDAAKADPGAVHSG